MRTKRDEGWGKLYRITSKELAKVNLNCYEGRTLRAIEYKTICFNKLSDVIPVTQFEGITGIERRNQKRAIKGLLKKGVIWQKGNEYGLCKRFLEYEDVSIETHRKDDVSIQSKRVVYPEQKRVYPDNLIRSSHKNNHKKGLSPFKDEDKNKKDLEGIGSVLKTIKRTKIKIKKNQ